MLNIFLINVFSALSKKKKVNKAREIKCKAFSEVSDLNFQSVLTIHACTFNPGY